MVGKVTRRGLTKAVLDALENMDHVGLVFPDPFVCMVGRRHARRWFFTWGDPVRIIPCAWPFDTGLSYERIGRETAKAAIEYERELQWLSRR